MLRYAIPVVVGLCGFGAERIHSWSQDHGRPAEAVQRSYDERRDEYRPRQDCDPRSERYEPRQERTWHIDLDIRRGDRDHERNDRSDRHDRGDHQRR